MSFIQYLKDTRAELHHVAWPTQKQTIIYTILVSGISVFVAAYLGFFDYIFTSSISRYLQVVPSAAPLEVTTTPPADAAPTPLPSFDIPSTE